MDSIIQYGLVAWLVNGFTYEAKDLLQLSEYAIATTFGFPVKREVPHAEIKGVKVDEVIEPLMELAKLMQRQLKAIGKTIFELHKDTMGHFIVDTLKALHDKDPEAYFKSANPAQHLVDALVTQFDDLNTSPFYSKAQTLVKTLYKQCRVDDKLFDFHDIGSLMATPDPSLAAVLRMDQLIMYPSKVDKRIQDLAVFKESDDATQQMLVATSLVLAKLASYTTLSIQDVEYHFRQKLKVA
eukprot:CAMPEP_0117432762 /NCGR_PEP_ID=MMETSP0758-20121206/12201_1 /TAXON_ID=63605 /ORGANISM="Percolomonas cosmopolitus, Strain AE-1 (ATCC 50343)" /LENGTH=239 /DNA_ID=CAMNT_0005222905 /DNA_START=246 /DNA_END=961 /DNA_ORIENTATION=-